MLHNRYIRNKVNRIVVNNRIDAILTSITVQGLLQIIFRYIQIFGHLIAVLAVMLKSADNSLKSDEAVYPHRRASSSCWRLPASFKSVMSPTVVRWWPISSARIEAFSAVVSNWGSRAMWPSI